jgi:DnaK suppressor protein
MQSREPEPNAGVVTTTRETLLAERARACWQAAALDRELAGIAGAAGEPGTDDEHDPEGATLAFERQHTASLLTRALERIAEIDAAIGRLDDGTYGTCTRCGQLVGEGRLAARPMAAACIRCARLPGPRSQSAISVMRPGTAADDPDLARQPFIPPYAHSRPHNQAGPYTPTWNRIGRTACSVETPYADRSPNTIDLCWRDD